MTVTPSRRAAVLGHPIDHSLSPVLHRAAYAELGFDGVYAAIDVTSEQLQAFLDGCGDDWVGLSLTMPLKESVIALLDDVDERARSVRSVNTVVFEDGCRRGFNTDIAGFDTILGDAGIDSSSTATIVGAGATARSAMAALAARGVSRVDVRARRLAAASELAALGARMGVEAAAGDWPIAAQSLSTDVVISTVPAEVGTPLWIPARPELLIDVLYHPWPTPLAAAWASAGGSVVGGLELLVGQAVEQVELMTGSRPDPDGMRDAGTAALAQRT
ncbi:MAG: shikimate dehydrogenase [Actinomycetes bacterium]